MTVTFLYHASEGGFSSQVARVHVMVPKKSQQVQVFPHWLGSSGECQETQSLHGSSISNSMSACPSNFFDKHSAANMFPSFFHILFLITVGSNPICSMYGVFFFIWVKTMGQMLVNIPDMEHMGMFSSMIFLWFSVCFLCFSYAFPWFSYVFLDDSARFS